MLTTRTLNASGWTANVSDTVFALTPEVVAQCLELVSAANEAFVTESTAAQRMFGEPTVFGRLDFTIVGPSNEQIMLSDQHNGHFETITGAVRPFEWEERAAGKGVTGLVNPEFASAFATVREDWPNVHIAVAPDRRGYDDHMWAGDANITRGPDVPDSAEYVIVRAEPGQDEYHALADRSISTVLTKGDKSYGEKLGWWTRITTLEEIPERGTSTVVLKPLQGSKTHGMLISPPRNKDITPGMVTRGRLEREAALTLEREGAMYLQSWHPPIGSHGQNLVLRVFFARGFSSAEWSCLGGCWNLRKNALVHGAKDTVFGPAVLA